MFEAYKIGVRLSLTNGITTGLMAIISQFRAFDKQVHSANNKLSDTEKMLRGIKRQLLVGGAMMGGGALGFSLLDKTVNAGREYAHQLSLMNSAGMKHLEIVKATQAAWEAGKSVPTASVTENLAAIRDLRMVFGDTAHATAFMPSVQKAQAILQMFRHGEAGSGKAEAYEMAKALEMKGAVKTPEQFMSQADMMTRALVATGGKIGASDFLSAFKYGRAATSGWNDSFAYTILPTLIQEMKTKGGSGGGAGGPGNALMSAYSAVVGGAIPQKSLKVWQKLGLLDPSKVVWDKVGSAKGVAPGGIMGSDTFQASPYEWANKFLIPSLKKAGYQTEAQQKQVLQYLFPNRAAGFVMSQFVTQGWKFERDQKLIGQAQGFGAYQQLLKDDPEMAKLALHKQWESLLAILGYQVMPAVIKGTQWLIETISSLSKWFSENQTLAKMLMYSLAGLSAVLLVGGVGVTLWAAFSLIGVALTAGGGLATLLVLSAGALTAFAIAVGLFTPEKSNYKGRKTHALLTQGQDVDINHFTPTAKASHAVHNHFKVLIDGKEVAHHIVGPNYGTSTMSLNPAASRLMPGTPALGSY